MSKPKVDRDRVAQEPRWSRLSESNRSRLIELIESGSSMEAVKEFRAVSGLGLGDSQAAIQAVLVGAPAKTSLPTTLSVSRKLVSWDPLWSGLSDEGRGELIALIESESWIPAIERFEALTGFERPVVQTAIENVIVDEHTAPVPDGSAPRIPLTPPVLARLHELFEPDAHEDAVTMLEECGASWECEPSNPHLERLRFVALALSEGDRLKLRNTVYLAHRDPRDVLAAAVHLRDVYPAYLEADENPPEADARSSGGAKKWWQFWRE